MSPALILPILLMCGPIISARADSLRLTPSQLSAIQEARIVGARYRVSDLLVAVIWKESSFCRDRVGDDGRSFGCGQIQLETAKRMAGRTVSANILIHDRRLNLELSAQYLHFCIRRFGIERGLFCYNHGASKANGAAIKTVLTDPYVLAVLDRFGRLGDLLYGP